jgi:hypothetical protein
MTSVTLKIRQYWTTGGGDTTGSVALDYSWDGTTWNNLLTAVNGVDADKTDTTEQSYTLSGFNGTTNLNTLRIRASAEPGSTYDESLHKTLFSTTTYNIYDLAVDACVGPILTVNAISGTTTLSPGVATQYSTIVTNDATNNCSWSIVSGGGALSGAVNDETSSRVTFTPPWTSNTTVLKATSNIDTSKSAQITVTNPGVTVNAVSGPTSVYAGLSGAYSATVTNDPANSCTWSIVSGGGSLSEAVNDGTSSRVTWTAPTASGGTAVLCCTSNRDATQYSQITVSVPLVGVSLTTGPSRLRVGTSGYYQVTVTGHSDNRVQWSVPAGSLSSNPANGTTWTVPNTPGRYVISGYHVYDTSKTFSYIVDVDYCPPTTSTYGVYDTNLVSATPINLAYAYDYNNSTYGEVYTDYTGSDAGTSYGYWDFYGILSVANIVQFNLTIYGYLYNCNVYYSVDNGGSWQGGWSQSGDYTTTPLVLMAAPGGIFDMSNVRIRIEIMSYAEEQWDPDLGKSVLEITNGYAKVYEIFCTPTLRAYTAITDTANHGTSPTALYMSSKFSTLTGTLIGVGTTPVAIGSGVGAIPFFTGAAGG